MFLDLELPPFAFLLIAFFVIKTLLSRAYSDKKEELSRPQRTAEEEAAFLEAQAEVQRKIAAHKQPKHLAVEVHPLKTIAEGLQQDLAALQALQAPVFQSLPSLKASERENNKLVLASSRKTPLQKAFVASLIFSKPKALE